MKKITRSKALALACTITLILLVSVGGTLAFLFTSAGPVTNTFVPNTVPVEVEEKFDKNVKENVYIQSDSEIPVYVRVALTATWLDSTGTAVGTEVTFGDLNDTTADLRIVWGDTTNWVKGSDGYYYYIKALDPNGKTTNLIEKAEYTAREGYQLNLEIMTQSIQAEGVNTEGEHPVVLAWESVISGGNKADLVIDAE